MGDKNQKSKNKNRKQKSAKKAAELKKKRDMQEQSPVTDLLRS